MEYIIDSLRADWQSFLAFIPSLIYAGIVLVLFGFLARGVARLVGRVMRRSPRLRPNERYLRRLLTWAIRIVGVMVALGVMGFEGVAASLLATGGVVAIVLGFAFREIGENLLAGIFLTFSRPFEVGDLVRTGDLTGTVRAIDIRSVHIRTADACDVFVPSAQIFRTELFNYTRDGLRRPDFRIGVAYHDDPETVLDLLTRTVRDTPDVLPEPPAVVQVDAFDASVITYRIFFWMDVNTSERDLLTVSNHVKMRCWRALRDAEMTFSTDVTTALDIKTAPPVTVVSAASS